MFISWHRSYLTSLRNGVLWLRLSLQINCITYAASEKRAPLLRGTIERLDLTMHPVVVDLSKKWYHNFGRPIAWRNQRLKTCSREFGLHLTQPSWGESSSNKGLTSQKSLDNAMVGSAHATSSPSGPPWTNTWKLRNVFIHQSLLLIVL